MAHGPARWLIAALALLAVPSAAEAQCWDPAFREANPGRCRARPSPVPTLRFGLEAGVGAWDRGVPVDHSAFLVAVPVDVFLVEWLAVGARAQVSAGGDAGEDSDGDGRDDDDQTDPVALLFTGGPRLVLHTEPARREAWRLELGGGWLESVAGGGESGPVIEAALARQGGILLVDSQAAPTGTGQELVLGIRGQLGLGDASDYRALFVTAGWATELWVPAPEGPAPRRTRPDLEHVLGVEGLAGVAFGQGGFGWGAGVSAGLAFGRFLGLRARADALRLEGAQGRDGVTLYGGLAGLRLSRWYLPWIEVLGGWVAALGTEPTTVEGGPVIELAAGAQFPNVFGCGVGLTVGQRVRFGLRDAEERSLGTILFAVGASYDSLIRASECWP